MIGVGCYIGRRVRNAGGGVPVPLDPSGLTATAAIDGDIDLSWTDNSTDELGFKIERSTTSGSGFTEIDTVGAGITTYNDTTPISGVTYYYRVRAYNAGGNSGYSNEATDTAFDWSSCVAYYKLDELSGNAIDSVNGNNGTVSGATQGVAGIIGTAYSFDGINDYVDVGDHDIFTFANGSNDLPFSISAWVKPIHGVSSNPVISKYKNHSPFDGEWALSVQGTGEVVFQTLDGATNIRCYASSNDALLDNQWSHIVITYDGSAQDEAIKIYINGSAATLSYLGQDGSYVKMENTTSKVMIGRVLYDSTLDGYFDGTIDELSVFGEELTSDEISYLYNGGSGKTYP